MAGAATAEHNQTPSTAHGGTALSPGRLLLKSKIHIRIEELFQLTIEIFSRTN